MTVLAFRPAHIFLQLGLADVREAEGKERLPRSDIEHVILLAEQQRGVIEDAVCGESLGRPLLCIWKQQETHTGDHYQISQQHREEQNGTKHVLEVETTHQCGHVCTEVFTHTELPISLEGKSHDDLHIAPK